MGQPVIIAVKQNGGKLLITHYYARKCFPTSFRVVMSSE